MLVVSDIIRLIRRMPVGVGHCGQCITVCVPRGYSPDECAPPPKPNLQPPRGGGW